jgi:hypothetical protein
MSDDECRERCERVIETGVSPPDDEVPSARLRTGLLFREKDPKPLTPRLAH